jgi:hypothetical protein
LPSSPNEQTQSKRLDAKKLEYIQQFETQSNRIRSAFRSLGLDAAAIQFFALHNLCQLNTLDNMWYVNKLFNQAQVESLSAKGFLVRSSGGVVRIEKYNCGAELRKTAGDNFQMTEIPCIMLQGQFALLWDAGYQKFLLTHDKRKVPAHKNQLVELRKFNEELRTALGVPTYYNEAIGSTCQISMYDRVKGRPGDVPDESAGVEEEIKH